LKPEVMSPAGHWPQLHAAIEAGADSVYFGLKHFSARAKVGFSLSELGEAMRTLHRRGVKGFVAFNTLVFDHELGEAAETLEAIAAAGADAVIVQDVGMVALARRIAPELEIHASTQMSVTSADGANLAQEMGASRVTLARELSLEEVRAVRAATSCELEIFVHGALCVAYSGQCFSSEAWGGRSANRGQCAQACRLPYELMVDGKVEPLGDARYLLSPGDLYALEQIPEIVSIGVSALKIEGRYKDAGYVALVTAAYRKAVDEAWAGAALSVTAAEALRLEQVYSRGLGPFFLKGTDHQAVVRGRAPRHRGVLMGRVARVDAAAVAVEPVGGAQAVAPLKAGDGVVFDAARWRSPEEKEEGGRVYQAVSEAGGGLIELRFGNGAMDFSRIRAGDLLWRTDDPEVERAARPFLDATSPVARQAVRVRVMAREGEPLETAWTVAAKPAVSVVVRSAAVLGRAERRRLDRELLGEQFGRLGNTAYRLGELELDVQGEPFAPASLLNQVRREAVERLEAMQSAAAGTGARINPGGDVLSALLGETAKHSEREAGAGRARLHLLVRTPEQLEAAIGLKPGSITLDYLDLYGLKPSVERVKEAGLEARVATPRVLKPGESRIVDFLLRLEIPMVVRPAGLVAMLAQRQPRPRLIGDFSLNAANAIAAGLLLEMGLERLTPTHDLNGEQVTALARAVGGDRLEVVAYQHLPVFHTEHCVFARFLSTGKSYVDCGRPCERHSVEVRDAGGRAHPVMADVGCRNTVFGAEAQVAAEHLESWLEAGIRDLRLEFAHESGEQVRRVTRAFEAALAGRMSAEALAAELKRAAPQGVTEGSLFVPEGYLTLPVLQ
jgi:U32 family peptidase